MGKSRLTGKRELRRLVENYGRDVLQSESFLSSASQKQHFHTSVAKHSRQVAFKTLRICRMITAIGVKVDEKTAVRAALCHDLGLVGKDQKYRNDIDSLKSHPAESLRIAKTIYPGMNSRMEQAILRHMWPVTFRFPSSPEGLAVSVADKLTSAADIISGIKRRGS